MEKAVGEPEHDILSLVHQFTTDVQGVCHLLFDMYPRVKHKSMKNRCKKLQAKLWKSYSLFLDQISDSHNRLRNALCQYS